MTDTNSSAVFPQLLEFGEYFQNLVWLGFLLIDILLFPLFIFVSQKNQERDKKTAIFPVISQCYDTVVIMMVLDIAAICLLFIGIEALIGEKKYVGLACLYIYVLAILLITSSSQTTHIILSLLAFQRFLIFSYPHIERFISFSAKAIRNFSCVLQLLICVKEVIVTWNLMEDDTQENAELKKNSLWVELGFFLSINILLLSSALLYIPIFIKIRKLSYLPSALQAQPHRYVFYQILSVMITKLVTSLYQFAAYAQNGSFIHMFRMSVYADALLTPFLIQITYLLCNKRNVDTWLAPILNSAKSLICPRHRRQVEPIGIQASDASR